MRRVLLALAIAALALASASAGELGSYSNAAALNGTERIPADQTSSTYPCTGCTVNITPAQILTYVLGQLASNTTAVGEVTGQSDVQSGTTYTFAGSDCGKTVIFTSSSAVTATIAASIVPASGTTCIITVLQASTAKISVNGTAVTAATLESAHSFTGTSGTQWSVITLTLTTISSTTYAILTGDGS